MCRVSTGTYLITLLDLCVRHALQIIHLQCILNVRYVLMLSCPDEALALRWAPQTVWRNWLTPDIGKFQNRCCNIQNRLQLVYFIRMGFLRRLFFSESFQFPQMPLFRVCQDFHQSYINRFYEFLLFRVHLREQNKAVPCQSCVAMRKCIIHC